MRPPLARAALALYPPSWRARYGDEVLALLDDSGGGPAAVASLAWHALPAWFWPSRHLHDRPARMRASLATALMSWSMLTGLGLVFAQLTQLQGLAPAAAPQIRWAYAIFDVTLVTSALIAGLGGLPLWLLMLRRAWREQRTRDTVYLLLPVIAPVTYLAGLIVTARLAPEPEPRVAAHHRHLADRHREVPIDRLGLRQVGDGTGSRARRSTEDGKSPGRRSDQSGDQLEQRALAGPVRPHHRDQLADEQILTPAQRSTLAADDGMVSLDRVLRPARVVIAARTVLAPALAYR